MESEVKYRSFICYRGGSSAGCFFAPEIHDALEEVENIVGKTYYALELEENFITTPKTVLKNAEYIIVLLTKHFFDGFIINGNPNPDSITRLEIDEALKNEKMKFILVQWNDFDWDASPTGISNADIILKLWGEEALTRIKGTPAIPFAKITFRNDVIQKIIKLLTPKDFKNDDETYKLVPSPAANLKPVFCGREAELLKIKEIFDSGQHVIFLEGIGGIGKTQLAMHFAKNHPEYSPVIYATYNGSIVDLVTSQQSPFKLDPDLPRKKNVDGTVEDDNEYFERKLKQIKEASDKNTLIIIDNFDVDGDPNLAEFLDANYKVIITTRCDYSKIYQNIIRINPLDSMEGLKAIFFENYSGYKVKQNDPHIEELINLVNGHTYTIELIAQHMENSDQTTLEMIEALKKEGIVSLNESVRSSSEGLSVAYQNLSKMFKVLNLKEEDKKILKIFSLMPITGVRTENICEWLEIKNKSLLDLERKSWLSTVPDGYALHPIIRDVVRKDLKITAEEAYPFLQKFNETIKEEYSWHFTIEDKCYYGDLGLEFINVFNELNDYTLELYKNVEILLSFGVKPQHAVELCDMLFNYYEKNSGRNSFMCGYYSFQAGWTYLFNLHLKDAFILAKEKFDISYEIFKNIKLNTEDEFAVYGHLLTHMARVYTIIYGVNKDEKIINLALDYAKEAVVNAEEHFFDPSPYYTRRAVAYMQLSEVYMAEKKYEEALSLLNQSYDIVKAKYGEDDPDSVNVSCRISAVLYNLNKYNEALERGIKNLAAYTSFSGELSTLRFEQLVIVYRCVKKVGSEEDIKKYKEDVIRIGSQILSDSSILDKILASD